MENEVAQENEVVQKHRAKFPTDQRSNDMITSAYAEQYPEKLDFYHRFKEDVTRIKRAREIMERPSLGTEFTRSLDRGFQGVQAQLYGTAEWAGEVAGAQGIEDWGETGRRRNLAEQAEIEGRSVASYGEIQTPDDFGRWLLGVGAENIPQFMGAIGSVAAGALLAPVSTGLATVAGLGTGLSFAFSQTQNFGALKDAGVNERDAALSAGVVGAFSAGLEVLLPMKFLTKGAKNIPDDMFKKGIASLLMQFGGRLFKRGVVDGAIEGTTEFFQEAAAIASEEINGVHSTDEEKFERLREALAAGTALGAGIQATGLPTALEVTGEHKKLKYRTKLREAAADPETRSMLDSLMDNPIFAPKIGDLTDKRRNEIEDLAVKVRTKTATLAEEQVFSGMAEEEKAYAVLFDHIVSGVEQKKIEAESKKGLKTRRAFNKLFKKGKKGDRSSLDEQEEEGLTDEEVADLDRDEPVPQGASGNQTARESNFDPVAYSDVEKSQAKVDSLTNELDEAVKELNASASLEEMRARENPDDTEMGDAAHQRFLGKQNRVARLRTELESAEKKLERVKNVAEAGQGFFDFDPEGIRDTDGGDMVLSASALNRIKDIAKSGKVGTITIGGRSIQVSADLAKAITEIEGLGATTDLNGNIVLDPGVLRLAIESHVNSTLPTGDPISDALTKILNALKRAKDKKSRRATKQVEADEAAAKKAADKKAAEELAKKRKIDAINSEGERIADNIETVDNEAREALGEEGKPQSEDEHKGEVENTTEESKKGTHEGHTISEIKESLTDLKHNVKAGWTKDASAAMDILNGIVSRMQVAATRGYDISKLEDLARKTQALIHSKDTAYGAWKDTDGNVGTLPERGRLYWINELILKAERLIKFSGLSQQAEITGILEDVKERLDEAAADGFDASAIESKLEEAQSELESLLDEDADEAGVETESTDGQIGLGLNTPTTPVTKQTKPAKKTSSEKGDFVQSEFDNEDQWDALDNKLKGLKRNKAELESHLKAAEKSTSSEKFVARLERNLRKVNKEIAATEAEIAVLPSKPEPASTPESNEEPESVDEGLVSSRKETTPEPAPESGDRRLEKLKEKRDALENEVELAKLDGTPTGEQEVMEHDLTELNGEIEAMEKERQRQLSRNPDSEAESSDEEGTSDETLATLKKKRKVWEKELDKAILKEQAVKDAKNSPEEGVFDVFPKNAVGSIRDKIASIDSEIERLENNEEPDGAEDTNDEDPDNLEDVEPPDDTEGSGGATVEPEPTESNKPKYAGKWPIPSTDASVGKVEVESADPTREELDLIEAYSKVRGELYGHKTSGQAVPDSLASKSYGLNEALEKVDIAYGIRRDGDGKKRSYWFRGYIGSNMRKSLQGVDKRATANEMITRYRWKMVDGKWQAIIWLYGDGKWSSNFDDEGHGIHFSFKEKKAPKSDVDKVTDEISALLKMREDTSDLIYTTKDRLEEEKQESPKDHEAIGALKDEIKEANAKLKAFDKRIAKAQNKLKVLANLEKRRRKVEAVKPDPKPEPDPKPKPDPTPKPEPEPEPEVKKEMDKITGKSKKPESPAPETQDTADTTSVTAEERSLIDAYEKLKAAHSKIKHVSGKDEKRSELSKEGSIIGEKLREVHGISSVSRIVMDKDGWVQFWVKEELGRNSKGEVVNEKLLGIYKWILLEDGKWHIANPESKDGNSGDFESEAQAKSEQEEKTNVEAKRELAKKSVQNLEETNNEIVAEIDGEESKPTGDSPAERKIAAVKGAGNKRKPKDPVGKPYSEAQKESENKPNKTPEPENSTDDLVDSSESSTGVDPLSSESSTDADLLRSKRKQGSDPDPKRSKPKLRKHPDDDKLWVITGTGFGIYDNKVLKDKDSGALRWEYGTVEDGKFKLISSHSLKKEAVNEHIKQEELAQEKASKGDGVDTTFLSQTEIRANFTEKMDKLALKANGKQPKLREPGVFFIGKSFYKNLFGDITKTDWFFDMYIDGVLVPGKPIAGNKIIEGDRFQSVELEKAQQGTVKFVLKPKQLFPSNSIAAQGKFYRNVRKSRQLSVQWWGVNLADTTISKGTGVEAGNVGAGVVVDGIVLTGKQAEALNEVNRKLEAEMEGIGVSGYPMDITPYTFLGNDVVQIVDPLSHQEGIVNQEVLVAMEHLVRLLKNKAELKLGSLIKEDKVTDVEYEKIKSELATAEKNLANHTQAQLAGMPFLDKFQPAEQSKRVKLSKDPRATPVSVTRKGAIIDAVTQKKVDEKDTEMVASSTSMHISTENSGFSTALAELLVADAREAGKGADLSRRITFFYDRDTGAVVGLPTTRNTSNGRVVVSNILDVASKKRKTGTLDLEVMMGVTARDTSRNGKVLFRFDPIYSSRLKESVPVKVSPENPRPAKVFSTHAKFLSEFVQPMETGRSAAEKTADRIEELSSGSVGPEAISEDEKNVDIYKPNLEDRDEIREYQELFEDIIHFMRSGEFADKRTKATYRQSDWADFRKAGIYKVTGAIRNLLKGKEDQGRNMGMFIGHMIKNNEATGFTDYTRSDAVAELQRFVEHKNPENFVPAKHTTGSLTGQPIVFTFKQGQLSRVELKQLQDITSRRLADATTRLTAKLFIAARELAHTGQELGREGNEINTPASYNDKDGYGHGRALWELINSDSGSIRATVEAQQRYAENAAKNAKRSDEEAAEPEHDITGNERINPTRLINGEIVADTRTPVSTDHVGPNKRADDVVSKVAKLDLDIGSFHFRKPKPGSPQLSGHKVVESFRQLLLRLAEEGVSTKLFKARFDGLTNFYSQAGGAFDNSANMIALVMSDVTNPNSVDLKNALHEIAHYLFQNQPKHIRDILTKAINTLPDDSLGLRNSEDLRIRQNNPDNLSPLELAVERVVESVAQSLDPTISRGFVTRLFEFFKEVAIKSAMHLQAYLFGVKLVSPELAVEWFNLRTKRWIHGGIAPEFASWLGGGKTHARETVTAYTPADGDTWLPWYYDHKNDGITYDDLLPTSVEAGVFNVQNAMFRKVDQLSGNQTVSPDVHPSALLHNFATNNDIFATLGIALKLAIGNGLVPDITPLGSFIETHVSKRAAENPITVVNGMLAEIEKLHGPEAVQQINPDIKISDLPSNAAMRRASANAYDAYESLLVRLSNKQAGLDFAAAENVDKRDKYIKDQQDLLFEFENATLLANAMKGEVGKMVEQSKSGLNKYAKGITDYHQLVNTLEEYAQALDGNIAREYSDVMEGMWKLLNSNEDSSNKLFDIISHLKDPKLGLDLENKVVTKNYILKMAERSDILNQFTDGNFDQRKIALASIIAQLLKSNTVAIELAGLRLEVHEDLDRGAVKRDLADLLKGIKTDVDDLGTISRSTIPRVYRELGAIAKKMERVRQKIRGFDRQKAKADDFRDIFSKALAPVIRSRMEVVGVKNKTRRANFEAINGSIYYLPSFDKNGNPTNDIDPQSARVYTANQNERDSSLLKDSINKMDRWIEIVDDPKSGYGHFKDTSSYLVFERQRDQLRRHEIYARNVTPIRGAYRYTTKLFGGLGDELRRLSNPSLDAIAVRLNAIGAAHNKYHRENRLMHQKWSLKEGKARKALGFDGYRSREFREIFYNDALHFIAGLKFQLHNKYSDEKAAAIALRMLRRRLLKNPLVKEHVANDVKWNIYRDFLLNTASNNARMKEIGRAMDTSIKQLSYKGKDIQHSKIIYRDVIGHPLFEVMRIPSGRVSTIYKHMGGLWTGMLNVDPKVAAAQEVEVGDDFIDLYPEDDVENISLGRIADGTQTPEAINRLLDTVFGDQRIWDEFVKPLAMKDNKGMFLGPHGSLASTENIKWAFEAATEAHPDGKGRFQKFLSILHKYETDATPPNTEVMSDLEFLKETIGTMNMIFRQFKSLNPEKKKTGFMVEGTNNTLESARISDDWPTEWVAHRPFDITNVNSVFHNMSYNAYLGEQQAAVVAEFDLALSQMLDAENILQNIEDTILTAANYTKIGKKAAQAQAESSAKEYGGIKNLNKIRQDRVDVEIVRRKFEAVIAQKGGSLLDLKAVGELASTMALSSVVGIGTAIIDTSSMWAFLTVFGLSPTSTRMSVTALKSFLGEFSNSGLNAIGSELHFNQEYDRLRDMVGAVDSSAVLSLMERIKSISQEVTGDNTGANVMDMVQKGTIKLSRMWTEVLTSGFGKRSDGSTFKPQNFFSQVAMNMHLATMFAMIKHTEELAMRGVMVYEANKSLLDNLDYDVGRDASLADLGVAAAPGEATTKEAIVAKLAENGMSLDRIVRDFIRRKRENGGEAVPILTPDNVQRVSFIAPNDITLESTISNEPSYIMMYQLSNVMMKLLGWIAKKTMRVAKDFVSPKGEIDLKSLTSGLIATAAVGGIGLAYSLLRDEYDEEILGKKSHIAEYASADSPYEAFLVTIDKLTRVGTFGLFGEAANAALNVDVLKPFSVDSRIFMMNFLQNVRLTAQTAWRQDAVTYSTFWRPFFQAIGGSGYLQYGQAINSITGGAAFPFEARATARINAANYLRGAGRNLGLEVRTFNGGGIIPTPMRPWVTEMALQAHADDPIAFQEAFNKAVMAARDYGKPDPVDYVKRSFRSKHPLKVVFKMQPNGTEYQEILNALPPEGREDVESAIGAFNRYGATLGLTPHPTPPENARRSPRASMNRRLTRNVEKITGVKPTDVHGFHREREGLFDLKASKSLF